MWMLNRGYYSCWRLVLNKRINDREPCVVLITYYELSTKTIDIYPVWDGATFCDLKVIQNGILVEIP